MKARGAVGHCGSTRARCLLPARTRAPLIELKEKASSTAALQVGKSKWTSLRTLPKARWGILLAPGGTEDAACHCLVRADMSLVLLGPGLQRA